MAHLAQLRLSDGSRGRSLSSRCAPGSGMIRQPTWRRLLKRIAGSYCRLFSKLQRIGLLGGVGVMDDIKAAIPKEMYAWRIDHHQVICTGGPLCKSAIGHFTKGLDETM